MHNTLQRQVLQYLGSLDAVNDQKIIALLNAISQTYQNYDDDRKLIEHSLEISSKELNEKNKALQVQVDKAEKQKKDAEALNALMIDRELKMIAMKKEMEQLKIQLSSPTTTTNSSIPSAPSNSPIASSPTQISPTAPQKIDGIIRQNTI